MAKLYCNLDKSVFIKIVLLISIIFLIAYILNYASSNKLMEALATQCSCHGPNFVATDSGCGSVAKPCCREPNKANPQPLCKDGPCGCHGPHFVTANDGCGSIGAPCCREPNKRDPKPFCTTKGANPLIDFVNADPNIYSTPITSSSAANVGTLGTPAPTSSNSPPSSWISHDGNCKATVINTYPTMQAALDSCECDDTCDALYKGKSGDWSTRKSCCNVKPRPSWCTDDNKCTTGISCNTQQGGTTYIKPDTSNPAKPVPAPVPSGKCIPNVPALAIVGNPILDGIAGNGCKNYTTKETCGPIGTMCPACCVWQGS